MKTEYTSNEMLTYSQKNANKKKWYKDKTEEIESCRNYREEREIKTNFDLVNNIINEADFSYVLKPYGEDVGKLPSNLKNVNIIKTKINTVIGIEKKRPFEWFVLATNPEATTRKEEEETSRLRDSVVSKITLPIRQKLEQERYKQLNNKEPTPEELERINQEVESQMQAMTPEEVKTYMSRKHQDPAEVLGNQLLEALMIQTDFKLKAEKALENGLIGRRPIIYVGVMNGEPELWVINPTRFYFEKNPDDPFIENSECAICEYHMLPSDVVKNFGEELTKDEINLLYSPTGDQIEQKVLKILDREDSPTVFDLGSEDTVLVKHYVWKSLRKIGFLTYLDEENIEREDIVSEEYRLDTSIGDVSIEWKWIPEVYETWKINDSFVRMRPIPGQFKDLDNLYQCKLPYYGVDFESSLVDALKIYQYLFDVLMFKVELLVSSDKGKKLLMNINAVPNSASIDLKKWQYFFEATPFTFYDTSEEGNVYSDANTIAKVLDMSLSSDIKQYIELAEYIRQLAGKAIGVSDQMEGQIQEREAVGNVKTVLSANSNILEPLFNLHSAFKRNVLNALIETAKVAYKDSNKTKLSYILDDMSYHILHIDQDLLSNSTLGLYISNSAKAAETKELIDNLAQQALQYQKVEFSDIISVVEQDSIIEAKEALKASEERRRQFEEKMEQMKQQTAKEEGERLREFQREQFEMEKELIVLKEEERRKTEIIKAAITGASFNPDADTDDNKVNDFLEIAKQQLKEAEVKHKQNLEERKFEHQKQIDKEKLKNEKEKISKSTRKQ
jgi:hypothetical protein